MYRTLNILLAFVAAFCLSSCGINQAQFAEEPYAFFLKKDSGNAADYNAVLAYFDEKKCYVDEIIFLESDQAAVDIFEGAIGRINEDELGKRIKGESITFTYAVAKTALTKSHGTAGVRAADTKAEAAYLRKKVFTVYRAGQ